MVDRNTKFYHAATKVRSHKKKIMGLKDVEGEWISDPMALAQMVQNIYKTLFTEEGQGDHSIRYPNDFLILPGDLQQNLSKTFSKDELKKALFEIAPYKVLGLTAFMQVCFKELGQL